MADRSWLLASPCLTHTGVHTRPLPELDIAQPNKVLAEQFVNTRRMRAQSRDPEISSMQAASGSLADKEIDMLRHSFSLMAGVCLISRFTSRKAGLHKTHFPLLHPNQVPAIEKQSLLSFIPLVLCDQAGNVVFPLQCRHLYIVTGRCHWKMVLGCYLAACIRTDCRW